VVYLKLSQVKFNEKTGQPIIDSEHTIAADSELLAALQKNQQIIIKNINIQESNVKQQAMQQG